MSIIIETCPKCGADLLEEVICTYPPIYKKHCSKCGWTYESRPEEVIRVPFQEQQTMDIDFTSDFSTAGLFNQLPCRTCSTNPANGGDGICNCTLGQPSITT